MWVRFLAVGLLVLGVAAFLTRLGPLGSLVKIPLQPLIVASDRAPAASVPAEPGTLAGYNLLIVTLDTTRPDRLGCYGSETAETPHLDRLAREGILFSNALAVGPTTLPSHASIFTGLYPHHHGARANSRFRLEARQRTLAERLSARGYATAAFVSALVLDRKFGLAQGFELYDDRMPSGGVLAVAERKADATTTRAIRWLRARGNQPYFAWVHYYDPHSFWEAPRAFAERHAFGYDAEIAFVDAELGRLLVAADKASGKRETLLVVVGDHGEALGEHGENSHGMLVQEAVLRIPLILHAPGLTEGLHIPTRVSQVDLAPTLLSLLGIESASEFDGADLLEEPDPKRMLLAENLEMRVQYGWARLQAVYAGALKFVEGPHPELYDVERDPLEQNDISAERPAELERLQQSVRLLHAGENDLLELSVALASDEKRRLASLGYVVSETERVRASGPGPDPKEMAPLMEHLQLLVSLAESPQPSWARWLGRLSGNPIPQGNDELAEELEKIATARPQFAPVYSYLIDLHRAAGREKEADHAARRMQEAIRSNLAGP